MMKSLLEPEKNYTSISSRYFVDTKNLNMDLILIRIKSKQGLIDKVVKDSDSSLTAGIIFQFLAPELLLVAKHLADFANDFLA